MAEITARLESGTRVTLHARHFTWTGGEPPEAGGENEGPTPYELLLGGLAACIAETLRLYATHKGIALSAVDVALDFGRAHADDCVDCEKREGGWVDRIASHVTLHGQFDDAQRARLTQVASRCPVHKTLANGVDIVDTVAFKQG